VRDDGLSPVKELPAGLRRHLPASTFVKGAGAGCSSGENLTLDTRFGGRLSTPCAHSGTEAHRLEIIRLVSQMSGEEIAARLEKNAQSHRGNVVNLRPGRWASSAGFWNKNGSTISKTS
jgi:hypothetical protein